MRRSRPYHLPFFQRKKTKPDGEIEELTLGPSVGSVLKCLILALLLLALTVLGVDLEPLSVPSLLPKLLPFP